MSSLFVIEFDTCTICNQEMKYKKVTMPDNEVKIITAHKNCQKIKDKILKYKNKIIELEIKLINLHYFAERFLSSTPTGSESYASFHSPN